MEDKDKRIEISLNADGFFLRKTNPHPLTAEQKHNMVIALLSVILFGFCVMLVWVAATMCGFPGFLFSLVAVAVLFSVILFKLDF